MKLDPEGNIVFTEQGPEDHPIVICHSINRRKKAFRSVKLTLANSTVNLTSPFQTKSCEEKFHVHSFQVCDVTPKTSSTWSNMDLPLFICDNGLKVG